VVSPNYQQQYGVVVLPEGLMIDDLYPNAVTVADIDSRVGKPKGPTPVTGTRRTPSEALVVTFQHGDTVRVKDSARSVYLRGRTGVVTNTKHQSDKGYVRVTIGSLGRPSKVAVKNLDLVEKRI
jgi:hypothetical protein